MMMRGDCGELATIAKGLYLEGLAVDYASNSVWYSDVIAGGVHGRAADGRVTSLNPQRMWTGGILLNHDGCVLSSGVGGIMWNTPSTGASGWLINEIGGIPINGVNEMIPDGTGGIYFGTIDLENILKGVPTRPASLYRLTAEGTPHLVADGLGLINGIMLSADRKRLYCNETFDATYVFDVLADMSLANRRIFLEKEDCDGMALDVEGNLWVTGFRSSELTRVATDGRLLGPLRTPAGAITQIRFGGVDMRDYFITCVPADGGDGLAVGVRPTEERSILYRGRTEVAGLPIERTRFKL